MRHYVSFWAKAGFIVLFGFLPSALAEQCLKAMEKIEEAADLPYQVGAKEMLYLEAIKLCPRMSEAYFNLGLYYLKEGRLKKASKQIEKAIEEREQASYRSALGYAYLANDRFDESAREYEKLLLSDPADPAVLASLSFVYRKKGDRKRAEDILRQALQLNPKTSLLYLHLGALLQELGKDEEALRSFETARSFESGSEGADLYLAHLYYQLGQFSEAEEVLLRAKKGGMVSAQHSYLLAEVYLHGGKHEQAQEILEQALEGAPRDAMLLTALGVVLTDSGEYERGLAKLNEALTSESQSSYIYGALGWAHLKAKHLDVAEEVLQRALELNERNAYALNNLGVVFELRGNLEQAEEKYRQARLVKPRLKH